MTRTSGLTVGVLSSLFISVVSLAQLAMTPEQIRERIKELNAKATTRPTTQQLTVLPVEPEPVEVKAARAAAKAEQQRLRQEADDLYRAKRFDIQQRIRAIDERLAKIRSEGVALESHRRALAAMADSEYAKASQAGKSTFESVTISQDNFGGGLGMTTGTIDNPAVSAAAMREVVERYGKKLEPIDARIKELNDEQTALALHRAELVNDSLVRPKVANVSPNFYLEQAKKAANPTEFWKEMEALYPGVDVKATWESVLAETASAASVDLTSIPPESEIAQRIRVNANQTFHKRCADLVRASLVLEESK